MNPFKNTLKKGRSVWKFLPLVVAGVPWILRDQLASNLEQESQEAQQVLAKLDAQETLEQQGEDLRELNHKLAEIRAAQKKVQGADEADDERAVHIEEDSAMAGVFPSEGRALERSAMALQKNLASVAVTPDRWHEIDEAAKFALETGGKLKDFKASSGQDQLEAEDKLLKDWDSASVRLTKAYEDLYEQALNDQTSSAVAAKRARYAAWIFTFVAALMMKDWTKAKNMATDAMGGTGDDDGEETRRGEAPSVSV